MLTWTIPCGISGAHLSANFAPEWAPHRWFGPIGTATWHDHADVDQSEAATCNLSLSPLISGFCIFCPQFVPKLVSIPKLYPEKLLIALIFPFEFYFNCSTCLKIMKFLSKISKFIMITPIIINSHFASIFLYQKFICKKSPFLSV
jgi:hypothetical protein